MQFEEAKIILINSREQYEAHAKVYEAAMAIEEAMAGKKEIGEEIQKLVQEHADEVKFLNDLKEEGKKKAMALRDMLEKKQASWDAMQSERLAKVDAMVAAADKKLNDTMGKTAVQEKALDEAVKELAMLVADIGSARAELEDIEAKRKALLASLGG